MQSRVLRLQRHSYKSVVLLRCFYHHFPLSFPFPDLVRCIQASVRCVTKLVLYCYSFTGRIFGQIPTYNTSLYVFPAKQWKEWKVQANSKSVGRGNYSCLTLRAFHFETSCRAGWPLLILFTLVISFASKGFPNKDQSCIVMVYCMYSQHATLLTFSFDSLFLTETYLSKARYSLFVLKVPLNSNQSIFHCVIIFFYTNKNEAGVKSLQGYLVVKTIFARS